jgi:membrane protein implicated in regulation of membrane protease activity
MEFKIWHFWVIAGIVFLIIEIFTPSFVAACIGIGAFFGALAAGVGLSPAWQVGFFAAGTILSFFTVRPLMLKYAYKGSEKVKTNVDSMVGKKGIVTERIDHSAHTGRVKIDGDDWKAESENEEIIETGSNVEVTKIESIIITVKQLKK